MNNLLMIGFAHGTDIKLEGYTTINHSPFQLEEGGISAKEYELQCKRILNSVNIVLLNLDKKHFTFDECYLFLLAYTLDIPLVGIGLKIRDELLNVVLSNKFDFLEEAISHIKNNYSTGL